MIPDFVIEGGLSLAMARAVSVAGLVAAAGGLLYASAVRPAGLDGSMQASLRRICAWSLIAAIGGALLWLAAQTQDMAGSLQPDTVWAVLGTVFGRLLAGRLVLLALAFVALAARRLGVASVLGCAALVLQAGHSHARAMGGSPALLASSALHVLAAGLWLGGLPGLLAVVAWGRPDDAKSAARRFSWLGIGCLAAVSATAMFQASVLVASVPGLVGTSYGWTVIAKAVLLVGLLTLAARNRGKLTPALPTPVARRALARSILMELGLGCTVLAAAGVLTELQPAMHSQAVWPFAWVPSLDAAREDVDVAREVAVACGALVAALAMLASAAWLRRSRRRVAALAACAACGLGWVAAPHLSPLLVPAVPTEFYRSPTGFSAASIVQGQTEYGAHCAACHGMDGRGHGSLAGALAVPPADLTASHLWMHSDGQMFWWLTHGIEGPRGGLVMPGFAQLDDDQRWALIDFVRARNAGLTLGPGGWTTPLMAPDFTLNCGGRERTLRDLRGRPIGVSFGRPLTVRAGEERCVAEDGRAAAAYAIAAPGAGSVLVDASGWLRAASAGPVPPDNSLAARPLAHSPRAMDMPADMKM